MKEFGESFDEFGFAETRETFEENVAAGENAGDDEFDDFFLSEEDFIERLIEGAEVFSCFCDFRFCSVIHECEF